MTWDGGRGLLLRGAGGKEDGNMEVQGKGRGWKG